MLPSESRERARRRALFIAYTFPPVGGAGVQRTTKFVKYLPSFGWDASVLTAGNPSVPVRDESLCRDVPASTLVIRARTFEPSYSKKAALASGRADGSGASLVKRLVHRAMVAALQPDPQILWNGPAFRRGIRALRNTPHDVIVASAPPFSSLLLGAALSRATNVPLVLDYRDEWSVSNQHWENRQLNGTSVALQRAMENYALRRASAVLATSPRSAAELQALCAELGATATVAHILNGFDPDDFDGSRVSARSATSGAFRLVYTGTLYNMMSPEPLIRALETLGSSRPDLAARIELVFAGRRAPEQAQRLTRLATVCRLSTYEYLSHAEAIAIMRSADALCLLLTDVPGADRVIPAKLFEYVASCRPILAIAPRGDVWDLLRGNPWACAFTPHDVRGIHDWIAAAVASGVRVPDDPAVAPRSFSRYAQAGQLASLLDALVRASQEKRSPVAQGVECSA